MRYFCYNEPGVDKDGKSSVEGSTIITKSEDEIRKEYFDYWLNQMCIKFKNKKYVYENYTFEDCLEDWKAVNWAWESKD